MLLTPFMILFELLIFAFQFAFIYGLAIMALFAFLAWLIAGYEPPTPELNRPLVEPIFECFKLDGCRLFPEASTLEEYCPDCIIKK